MIVLISNSELCIIYAGTSAGSMLALYIASKGGAVYQTMQDSLPKDKWLQGPLQQGSTAVAWRTVRALADSVFTPPWRFFLRRDVQMQCHPATPIAMQRSQGNIRDIRHQHCFFPTASHTLCVCEAYLWFLSPSVHQAFVHQVFVHQAFVH